MQFLVDAAFKNSLYNKSSADNAGVCSLLTKYYFSKHYQRGSGSMAGKTRTTAMARTFQTTPAISCKTHLGKHRAEKEVEPVVM